MKLHNTLTQRLEEVHPIAQPVTFYSCGPTVYDYLQIGNWAAFIRWDMLARTLKANGYDVNWIMNITDVGHLVSDADEGEDKLEKGAKREGKTAWEIAEYYTQDFLHGLDAFNISIPRDHLPKATDHIPEQIDLIKRLEEKGYTYIIDDGVYFDTSKFENYGALARLNIDELKAGARVAFNEQKRNISDFALWKFSPIDQKRDMEWDSPWGKGFPGWHLECSAMSMKYLGETIDIHTGGIDHIPVHHTNEIAQSEAATGKPFVNIWLHSNFLTVDGVKLSKSLQNSYTLQDLVERGFSPLAYRMFVLQSHYRTQANFTWENLTAASNRLRALHAMADLQWQPSDLGKVNDGEIQRAKDTIAAALSEDLNTPEALAALNQFETHVTTHGVHSSAIMHYQEFITWLDEVFGLQLAGHDITAEQKALLQDRAEARQNKDWEASDALRDELTKQGIAVRDTDFGQVWQQL